MDDRLKACQNVYDVNRLVRCQCSCPTRPSPTFYVYFTCILHAKVVLLTFLNNKIHSITHSIHLSHFINIKFAFKNPLLWIRSFTLAHSLLYSFFLHFLPSTPPDSCFAFALWRNSGLKFKIFCYSCSRRRHHRRRRFTILTNLQLFDKQEIREIDWNHWNGCTLSQCYIDSNRIASHRIVFNLLPAATKQSAHTYSTILSNYSIESM